MGGTMEGFLKQLKKNRVMYVWHGQTLSDGQLL